MALFSQRVVLPHCTFSSASGVTSSIRIHGKLVHGLRRYVVRDAQVNEVMVAECRWKHCSTLYRLLKKEPLEAPAYAEFCGPFLTFLSVNQHALYTAQPPAQSTIDENTVMAHRVGLCALSYLLVIVAGYVIYKQKKSGKRRGASD